MWIIALTLFTATFARAYEVDNFTDRDKLTHDSRPALNVLVNKYIERAIKFANKEGENRCYPGLLRQGLVQWVGPDPVSIMEVAVANSSEVQHSTVGMDQSIYAGAKIGESPSMWVAGIGRSILLSGQIVGSDKMGHFFMQGLEYFERVHISKKDINYVLATEHGEDGLWGIDTSGVKSYADMAVNFQGYRFWYQLTEGTQPYVRCENSKKWVKARDFDFADYVNVAWDEGINCSEYRPALATRVKQNMDQAGLSCPIRPMDCLKVQQLEKSEFFISPACREAILTLSLGTRESLGAVIRPVGR